MTLNIASTHQRKLTASEFNLRINTLGDDLVHLNF